MHPRWDPRECFLQRKSTEKFVYRPLSGVCLPVDTDVSHQTYAAFSIPLIFDFAIIILTAFKVFRLASGLRKQSGADIVRHFPFLILCAVLSVVVLGSSTSYFGMGFCTYNCERTSAISLTVNRFQATLSSLLVHQIGLPPFPAHEKYNRPPSVY